MAEPPAESMVTITRTHRTRGRAGSRRPAHAVDPNEAVRVVSGLVNDAAYIERAHRHLEELAWALGRYGWYARLDSAMADRPLRLYVVNLHAGCPLSEHVIAVPATDGTLWFWFERGDPIAAATDIEDAVTRIMCDLADPGG